MDNIYIRTDPAENIKADKEKFAEKNQRYNHHHYESWRVIYCGNNTGASVYDNRESLFE